MALMVSLSLFSYLRSASLIGHGLMNNSSGTGGRVGKNAAILGGICKLLRRVRRSAAVCGNCSRPGGCGVFQIFLLFGQHLAHFSVQVYGCIGAHRAPWLGRCDIIGPNPRTKAKIHVKE